MKLRAGIYSSGGTKTCGGFPGSLGHEDVDAEFYADMGFDALKYDNCFHEGQSGTPEVSAARFAKMSDAITATKRKMVLALCNWGQDQPWSWADEKWNSWRITGDIGDDFGDDLPNCIDQPPPTADYGGYDCSVRKIIDKVSKIANAGQSGGWNDMDMLEIGNGNMTQPQEKTHFSMWALAKSPLILGNDMAKLSIQTLAIVGNTDIIAVSQDALHESATRVAKLYNSTNGLDVWSGRLSGGAYVVSVTSYDLKAQAAPGPDGNVKATDYTLDIQFKDVIQSADDYNSFDIYDLWSGVNWDDPKKSVPAKKMEGSPFKQPSFSVQTHLHDTQVYKIVPKKDT